MQKKEGKKRQEGRKERKRKGEREEGWEGRRETERKIVKKEGRKQRLPDRFRGAGLVCETYPGSSSGEKEKGAISQVLLSLHGENHNCSVIYMFPT